MELGEMVTRMSLKLAGGIPKEDGYMQVGVSRYMDTHELYNDWIDLSSKTFDIPLVFRSQVANQLVDMALYDANREKKSKYGFEGVEYFVNIAKEFVPYVTSFSDRSLYLAQISNLEKLYTPVELEVKEKKIEELVLQAI